MIAKLVTWGKDREEAMRILDRSLDEYVIKGVTHNMGFGKSILANQSFWDGNYSTAFIDTFYKKGFSGDPLTQHDYDRLAVVAHQVKNIHLNQGAAGDSSSGVLYVTIDGAQGDSNEDYKVEKLSEV
jgi:acetyl/propionyl-CoA carboxylase alpha subunit